MTETWKDQTMDASGKYVRYTQEQVEALERVYHECPKPSSIRRHQLIKESPILANIEPKQIKVWFQNRRCREKQRKEATRLVSVNAKLTALNKLLMEENERLAKHTSQLTLENHALRQQIPNLAFPDGRHRLPSQSPLKKEGAVNGGDESSTQGGICVKVHGQAGIASTDTSCDSAVTGGLPHRLTPQHSPRDSSPAGLLATAEETLTEFLAKATGTAVDWIQLPGMKPGPDAIGIIAISHGCVGIAARACGLVALDISKVTEVLKDRPGWLQDCRRMEVLGALPTGNGGTIELLYTQMYAPTTLAPARDYCTLRYTTILEDGNVVICERSLSGVQGGPTMPPVQSFVRGEMYPSGYLIRPCDGGGCIIHVVDHYNNEPWSVPEVLRPLYESPAVLSQKSTLAALRHLRRLAAEESGEGVPRNGQHPAVLRTLCQRLAKGFNNAVNGFPDDGWEATISDGLDDVSVMLNATPKSMEGQIASDKLLYSLGGGILCAKASMLLQNVPSSLLVRFLREHRSEWADYDIDANVASFRSNGNGYIPRGGGVSHVQLPLPLAYSGESGEILEVVKVEGHSSVQHMVLSRDTFLLQLCSGVDESALGACAQLVFAPVDVALADDIPLLPSGFCVSPIDTNVVDGFGLDRTLDLASTLEGGNDLRLNGDAKSNNSPGQMRSVLTIAFQFAYEVHTRETVAAMARQYVRNVVASVQQVAMALAPSRGAPPPRQVPSNPDALSLVRHVLSSYRFHMGIDLIRPENGSDEALFKAFWHHTDAIVCCALKGMPEFVFANRSGLEMFETATASSLKDLDWEKTLNENDRKLSYATFTHVLQQGYCSLPAGVRMSSTGRTATYEQALAWKVLNDSEAVECIAFLFINWSLVT